MEPPERLEALYASEGVTLTGPARATNSLVEEWVNFKMLVKQAEALLEKIKPKLGMLLPAGRSVRAFRAHRWTKGGVQEEGRIIVRRVKQDRRGVDQAKLTALLESKNAPAEAFNRTANEDFVAKMLGRNDNDPLKITEDELRSCLKGKTISYVQATFSVDPEDMKLEAE